MPTLAGLDGASMVPDTLGLLERGQKFGRRVASDALTPDLIQQIQAGGPESQAALTQLSTLNPQAAQNLFALQGQQRKDQEAQQIQMVTDERIKAIQRKGNIQKVIAGGEAGLRNNIAKIALELQDDPEFDAKEIADLSNLAVSDPAAAMAQLQGELDAANAEIEIADQILKPITGLQKGFSAKTVTYSDGTSVQFDNRGNRVVTDSTGNVLEGQAAADAISKGVQSGITEQTERAAGRAGATKAEQRASDLISRGVAAAESTATIRRALALLDVVETGGVDAISLAVKSRLGIEGADEGELSNSLGKSVLSQLRETFGAAFTQAEGERLERIEAGFGKSPATNKRLLQQALRIAENTARRAAREAKKRGTGEDVDIEDLLTFSLDIDEGQDAPTQETTSVQIPTITTQAAYDALPSGAEFIEDGVKYRKP